LILVVVLLILAALFVATWGVRRHGEAGRARRDWRATEERFIDPSTARTMRVFVDEQGGRHYVPE